MAWRLKSDVVTDFFRYEPLPLLITKDPQKLENLYLRGEHPLHPGVGRMWLTHTTSKL